MSNQIAKFKLNEEVLIYKSGENKIATIIERNLVTNLDNGKSEVIYYYITSNSNMSYSMKEDTLLLLNEFALHMESK